MESRTVVLTWSFYDGTCEAPITIDISPNDFFECGSECPKIARGSKNGDFHKCKMFGEIINKQRHAACYGGDDMYYPGSDFRPCPPIKYKNTKKIYRGDS